MQKSLKIDINYSLAKNIGNLTIKKPTRWLDLAGDCQ
ncbi:hypothetical protein SAMN05216324_13011 [Chryseobacterium limigenitum]|uniref:Uncharacterized protein n=1 Tax=Chryseobacterium limigenitum TaxID=1612149 RepID=A0A1K2IWW9_9FLAO|nr:hypothetical protein SAMN05216324_13011 [Chryseobacterium limigenitum]